MLDGFYFVKGDGSAQYSFPFPRQALGALFSAQALQRIGTTPPSLTITVEHKNRDDAAFVSAGSFAAITAATGSPVTLDLTGLREEIRFAFGITAANAWEGYLIRLLPPGWHNT